MQDHSNPSMNRERLSQLMDGEWHELNPSDCVRGICADPELRDTWARYHLIRDVIKQEPLRADRMLLSRICDAIAEEPAYSNITPLGSQARAADAQASAANAQASAASSQASAASSQASAASSQTSAASSQANAVIPDDPDVIGESGVHTGVRSSNPVSPVPSTDDESGASWLRTGLTGFALAASVATVTVLGMNLWQDQTIDETRALAGNPVDVRDANAESSERVTRSAVSPVNQVASSGSYWARSSQRLDSGEERLNLMMARHIENSPTAERDGMLQWSRMVGYDARDARR